MKIKILFGLLFLLPLFALAQKSPRQILRGKVVADSLKVENISIQNISSNIGAVTDDNGNFTIYARANDTLLFTSVTFRSGRLVLKPEHFLEKLVVKLDINVTELDEVIITPLTGQLDKDSKDTKTLRLNTGLDNETAMKLQSYPKPTTPVNTAMPATESTLQGVNFIGIYDMIFKPKKRKKDRGEIYGGANSKSFTESVKERFTYHFWTQTLKIPHDEIGLFLTFCDNGEKTAWLLDPKNEFELTDYLVAKSAEYLKKEK